MEDIARLSDKVLVIDSGRLVTSGTPKEVFSERDTLEAVGLALPPVTQFTETLRQQGIGLSGTILSVQLAAEEIYHYLKGTSKE